LRGAGHALRDHPRKNDILCRYGGDEFVLIPPDSSVADTQERLEQIRLFLKEFQVHYGERNCARSRCPPASPRLLNTV
jgi:diguanylate cyclase (GGDEF)-like protein